MSMDTNRQSRIGQTFGKCTILKYIGRGGMGTVWLGEHLFLRRQVAIKILHNDLSSDPEEMARFEREAIAAAISSADWKRRSGFFSRALRMRSAR